VGLADVYNHSDLKLTRGSTGYGYVAYYAENIFVAGGECGDGLDWALSDEGLLRITGSGSMPDWPKTTKVPWYQYKDSIKSVSIEGATSVGKKAFYGYPSLISADLGCAETVGDFAFYNCGNLASISFGQVRSIGEKAFSYCGVPALVMPETLAYVGPYAFFGCPELASLDIPGDGVVLDRSAFSSCRSMEEITFSGHGTVIGANAFYKNNGVRSVDLSTVASVGSKAFPYCDGLESVVIPDNLYFVGSYAFYKCANLKVLVVEDGVKKIMGSAFGGCRSLESVYLSKTLTYIGENAFHGVAFADQYGNALEPTLKSLRGHDFSRSGKALRMVTGEVTEFSVDGISYSVTSPGAVAVTGHEGGVSSVPCEASYEGVDYAVTSIGKGAFLRCPTLTSADLSNAVTLEFKALGNCTGVEHIVFGDCLESIGSYALYGLSFYDGDTRLKATPDNLRGHSFSGTGGILHLVA
jgi:hypothetical protein